VYGTNHSQADGVVSSWAFRRDGRVDAAILRSSDVGTLSSLSRALSDGLVLSRMRIAEGVASNSAWQLASGVGDESVDLDTSAISNVWLGVSGPGRNPGARTATDLPSGGLHQGTLRGHYSVWDCKKSSVLSVRSAGAWGDASLVTT